MQNLHLYKPNSKNTGGACSISCYTPEGSKSNLPITFIGFIRQYSWDDSSKNGSFSENKGKKEHSCNLKFSDNEIAELIYALRYRKEAKFFHSFDGQTTSINLTRWEQKGELKGFGFSAKSKDMDKPVGIPLSFADAELLIVYFTECLRSQFHAKNA